MPFASDRAMAMTSHAMRYVQRRLARKLIRQMPILGAVVAIATVGAAMRRKGVVNGALDTALDFTPFVGLVKNVFEIGRGRDLFADRPPSPGSGRERDGGRAVNVNRLSYGPQRSSIR